MKRQQRRWNTPRWFIIYTASSQFSSSFRAWPELRPGWVSVKGPFNLKRDAEAVISEEIHARAVETTAELRDEVSRARARVDAFNQRDNHQESA